MQTSSNINCDQSPSDTTARMRDARAEWLRNTSIPSIGSVLSGGSLSESADEIWSRAESVIIPYIIQTAESLGKNDSYAQAYMSLVVDDIFAAVRQVTNSNGSLCREQGDWGAPKVSVNQEGGNIDVEWTLSKGKTSFKQRFRTVPDAEVRQATSASEGSTQNQSGI
ncbi:hypothetical protein BD324DRAFT_618843 [Kockovaella imperatae]|uniref:Uncharacterized protein n=1 Tax=Kockovaella imperatae TaxID=4999 RepID=A0A1Y1UMC9_9TREE|nr:hypothetical protein BD324DRAFT_618843 [Kockovaella imperatae]ORX39208.1 hypothetical protein BD324DRAFT_618843 [Kockovaella imperatae]